MSFLQVVEAAQKHYPNLRIKYKDQSTLMKILGTLMFFNKNFMTNYTTTFGSTVYFPSESFVKIRPVSSSIILFHELMHIKDGSKISKFLFTFLYLCPQILALFFFPLLFISWKIALLSLLFVAPIPAFFRMYFEKRAYFVSLYSLNKLSKILKFNPLIDNQKQFFLSQFNSTYYYYMWPFNSLKSEFNLATYKILNNERPIDDPFFDILDDLITKV